MYYWPNPAHKRGTTEAGPPAWRPDKEPCPDDMTVAERDELLRDSIAIDSTDPRSRRFNVRRGIAGLEFFDAKLTRVVDGDPEYHAHPATFVPARVLRAFRDAGKITAAEYRRCVKGFGCP